jgi:hypothetical protein
MLGLGLPGLLHARPSVGLALPAGRSEKSCIFICLYGGASQIDTWDMKPDAPAEIRGPSKPTLADLEARTGQPILDLF